MTRDRSILAAFAVLGGLLYAHLMFFLPAGTRYTQFGDLIYNYYYMAVINGNLNVPAQIIGPEGHYNSDGLAFPYHGLAPLVTRFIASIFLDLSRNSVSNISVFAFSFGTALVYTKFFLNGLRYGIKSKKHPSLLVAILLCLGVWLVSPASMLVVNDSVYHEPIVIACFLTACFLLVASSLHPDKLPPVSTIAFLSICAGATVFARPHVAVGLYIGTILFLAYYLWRHGKQAMPIVVLSLLILLVCGVTLLAINASRFGNPFRMHGALHRDSLEMGFVYFGFQPYDTPRNLAFAEHGRFNLTRLFPNILYYFLDTPYSARDGESILHFRAWLDEVYANLTRNMGFIRNEDPRIGALFLWTPWCLLALLGVFFSRRMNAVKIIMLLTATVIFILITSYGTITLRYRAEIWPLIAVLVWLFLSSTVFLKEDNSAARLCFSAVIFLTTIYSVSVSLSLLSKYAEFFQSFGYYGVWPYELCSQLVSDKETLGPSAVQDICVIKE